MSRFSERAVFTFILLGILIFGIGTGAGAAGFVVTRTMWTALNTKVNQRATIATLNARVTTMNARINGLAASLATVTAQAETLRSDVTALRLAAMTPNASTAEALAALAAGLKSAESSITVLRDFDSKLHVTFSDGIENGVKGPHVVFNGVNVHVRNGAGGTGTVNGLGNLIIGYDALRKPWVDGKWREPEANQLRSGSHNLVLSDMNYFTSSGGIVAGSVNTIQAPGSSVFGGSWNQIKADASYNQVIVGGNVNTIEKGVQAENVIVGGGNNHVFAGTQGAIVGGYNNALRSSGGQNSLLGGAGNTVFAGSHNSISGGYQNQVSGGDQNSILGGAANKILAGSQGSISAGYSNEIRDSATWQSSILGGALNKVTRGMHNTVLGGTTNVNAADNDITLIGGFGYTASQKDVICPQPWYFFPNPASSPVHIDYNMSWYYRNY